ncbi:MAG: peptidoglycan DD-metalloendopeptidase family protein [Minisyncoccia bacterium]
MRLHFQQLTILLFLTVVMLTADSLVHAQTIEELQQKITSQASAIQKLELEISQYQGDLATLATKKNTLKNAIALLEITRKKLETDIRLTQTKVDTTNLTIRQLSSEITYKENEISVRIAALKEALLSMYERDSDSLAEVALSNESFSGLWNDIDMLEQYSQGISDNLGIVKSLKSDLEIKNNKKQNEKGKLLDLKSTLNDQKKVTENTKKQQTQLLTQTSSQESKYQKTLKEKLTLKDALEKELKEYESTLKFILDPKSIPPRGTKVFSYPVDNVRITQYFGNTAFARSGAYNGSGHNGIDFGVSVGTPVKAMLPGKIIGTGNTDQYNGCYSYGKWVLVEHFNGLSMLYAHLSLIKVSNGQSVSTGDLVGYSGNTGYSTGPHLHLSVFVSAAVEIIRLGDVKKITNCADASIPVAALNAYLNPMDYL